MKARKETGAQVSALKIVRIEEASCGVFTFYVARSHFLALFQRERIIQRLAHERLCRNAV